jgi:hypothetical protein
LNLKRRLKKLEKKKGVGESPIFLSVRFVSPDGSEALTPEETAALDDYEARMEEEAKEGCVVLIMRTREKAQELLAQAGKE